MKRFLKLSFVIPFAFLSVAALAQSNGTPGGVPGSTPTPSASPTTPPVNQPPATQQPAAQPFGTQQQPSAQPFGTQQATPSPLGTPQTDTYNNLQPAVQDTSIKGMGESGDTLSPNGDIVSPPPVQSDTSSMNNNNGNVNGSGNDENSGNGTP